MNEITFGFVKPDAYTQREQILEEFILPKLSVVREKDSYEFTEEAAREHYWELRNEPFFANLINFTVYGLPGLHSRYGNSENAKTALYVFEGEDAVRVLDEITGPTNPGIAKYNAIRSHRATIRSRFGRGMPDNAFHRSDSRASARREIMIHFKREELPDYVWEMLDSEPYVS